MSRKKKNTKRYYVERKPGSKKKKMDVQKRTNLEEKMELTSGTGVNGKPAEYA